jgi:hypothetical protein
MSVRDKHRRDLINPPFGVFGVLAFWRSTLGDVPLGNCPRTIYRLPPTRSTRALAQARRDLINPPFGVFGVLAINLAAARGRNRGGRH